MSMLIENRVSGLYGTDQKNFRSIAYGNDVMRKLCKFDGTGDFGESAAIARDTLAGAVTNSGDITVYYKFLCTQQTALIRSMAFVGAAGNVNDFNVLSMYLSYVSSGVYSQRIACKSSSTGLFSVFIGSNINITINNIYEVVFQLNFTDTNTATAKFYLAGAEVDSEEKINVTKLGSFDDQNYTIQIGKGRTSTWSESFAQQGLIDLAVFNAVYTPAEVVTNMANAVLRYKCNEGQALTLNDSGSFAKNLTVTLISAAISFYSLTNATGA